MLNKNYFKKKKLLQTISSKLTQGTGNTVHKNVVIEGEVSIGSNNYIGPGTILIGPLVIGDDNWIVAASIGFPPEHSKWHHSKLDDLIGVRIGSNTVIREYVTIHSGYESETVIEDNCFIMSKSYIGHDAVIKSGCTIAPASMVGGHVIIDSNTTLGMSCVIHQRLSIGKNVMIGMNSTVTNNVEDFALIYGSPATTKGINRVGLQRNGWTNDEIDFEENLHFKR